MSFSNKVFKIVREIPYGQVLTYKQVATFAGSPAAYQAVGNIIHKNPDLKNIPCHRVIRSDGYVGDYAFGGPQEKKKMLESEGIKFDNDFVIINRDIKKTQKDSNNNAKSKKIKKNSDLIIEKKET